MDHPDQQSDGIGKRGFPLPSVSEIQPGILRGPGSAKISVFHAFIMSPAGGRHQ
jgi:hypothetical protein